MAELGIAVASSTMGNLATEYASPYLSYFFRFGKIVEDFKNRRNQLELRKIRVENDVAEAKKQTQVIEKDVEEWLTRAEKKLGEAQSLEDEIERNKCFNWCPSWGWRYCLSIEVAKKTLCISQLLENSNFERVGYRATLPGLEFIPSKDFMSSESSNSAFKEIMEALNNGDVNMIGLYGMGGVGKTTLAKEVGNQAKQLFDKVEVVTVSQNPNINNIQDKIADFLDLDFQKKTPEGRAEQLWLRIKDEKSILIILDDVWEELDLKIIGIPFGDDHKGCKIFLTTRLQEVCTRMHCQREVLLKILSDDEAWALFKDSAGLKDNSPTLKVAKEVALEGKGLPLAIVTMAKALKDESLDGWIAANLRLKESRHLDNQHVCGEDREISVALLTVFGIGLGLFGDINLIENLRREIRLALSKLQKSGLLLQTDDEESVKMHDVVRDFAHWITSTGEKMFMVKNKLTEWPNSENFDCYTAISLWNSKIDNFPERLEFSKLKTLILSRMDCQIVPSTFFEGMNALQILFLEHLEFSMEAFKFLTNLRIMRIVKCGLQEDISSLRNLKNLEFLELTSVRFEELPEELLELRRLKSLYFSCSGDGPINVPPNLLSRLTSLQELHVPRDNNANLLELNSLSRLTTLTLIVSTDQCFQENFVFPKLQSYSIAVNAYIEFPEKRISRILTISDCSSLNAFKELFPNVQKLTLFKVMEHKTVVPNVDQWGLNELTSLQLTSCDDLECLIDTTWEQSPTTAFSNLVNLDIGKMTSLKELCNGQSPNSFLQNLETLIICDCGQLQSVFQMNGQMLSISNLRSLELQSLPALESIWKEPTHYVSLQSLKDVKVDGCDKLKSIFSPYLAQSLLHLEQLKISACKKLEQVFAFAQDMAELEENQAPPLSNLICLELESVPELRCIWREPTHLVKLKSLKTMRIGSCSKLEYLFSPTLAQALVHLEELKIKESNSLKHLIMEAENGDEIVSNKERSLLCWPKLKSLEIASCKSLRYVFPITLAQGLPYLESVQIIDCPQLMHVFNMAKEEDKHDIMLPKLQFLRLEDLENLRSFCPRNCFVKLPSFKGLEASNVGARPQDIEINAVKELLYNVKSLALTRVMYHKNLVPNVDPKGLNELTFLALKDGKELECLIDTTEGHVSTSAFFNLVELVIQDMTSMKMLCNGQFPKGFLQKLEKLEATNCMEMVSLSPALQDLKEVKVINCGQLQEVFQIDELLHDAEETLLSNLALMELQLLPQLQWIWKGSTHFVRLQSLKILEISFCNSLKYLFSPSLAQSLVLLDQLKIYHCYGLQHIIKELDCDDGIEPNAHLHSPFLPKLETLTISNCPKLEYVFQISLAQVPPRLKFVWVSDSPQLQQVFNMVKEKHGVDRAIALPCLQQLQLGNLINLSCFFSENFLITSPSLENLVFWDCPKLTNFTIQKEVNEQAQLKDLGLHAMKDLLYNAKSLTLKGVMYQKNLVPNVDPKGLNELTFLALKDGKELECLIDTTEGHVSTNAFFNLVQLVMQEMIGFKMLCNGRIPKGFLQKLEKLEATNCMEMVSLSPALQDLKEVKVINCGQLQEVFQIDELLRDTEEPLLSNLTLMELHLLPELKWIWKGSTHFVRLQSLKYLAISFCNSLKYLFSPSLAQSLVLLEHLNIYHCYGLQHIINELDCDDGIEPNAHLHSPFLPKLETLTISNCPKLEYVFQISLAQVPPRLKFVWISDSPQLQQVFNVAKEKHGVDRAIALPCLQQLQLGNLINLSCFFSENFLIASPSLENLVFWDCPKLTNFTIQKEVNEQAQLKDLGLHAMKDLLYNAKSLTLKGVMYQKNLVPNVDPKGLNELTFLLLKDGKELECLIDTTEGHVSTNAFFNLVQLVIQEMTGFKMLCNGRIPKGFLQKLEKLEATNCMEMVSLSPMLQNLKEVKVINCGQLQEVFQTDEILHDTKENQGPLLSNLTLMELHSLPELKLIWKGSTHFVSLQSLMFVEISYCNRLKYLFSPFLAQSLVLLEQLKIDHCNGLQHIITELEFDDEIESEDHPYSPLLPKLETLTISDCPKLEYVFQTPLAQVLPRLKFVWISNSPQLQQLFNVTKEENGVGRAIVLPCLQDLRLGNLINLSCFCSKNFLIAAPSLEKLVVFNCLKLSNFTIQKEVNQQAQLKELYLSDLGNDKGCNTINSQSRWRLVNLEYITVGNCVKIFQMQAGQFFSRVENIQLEHLHQLQGPILVASLQCLRWLHVSKCNRLKYLLSPMLVRNLPHLTHLEINHCEELEEIIEMDQTSASSSQAHLQPISFPSLEIIRIYKCSNLKSLFPLGITCSPSKVKIISIDGASKLERVFNLDVEDDQKGIVLPNLQGLLLKELPSLKSLSQGYHFRFPCMHYAEVKECPKLSTSFSIDSKRAVHAITEAPEQVENDRREGLITKEEIVDNQAACNDVFWLYGYQEDTLPLYMNVDEADDN
ncbi:hypothetical protein POUND7_006789 [Theobroma cacao]